MKNKSLFALIILFSVVSLNAQFNGKPKYEILTTQAGDTLGTITVELFPAIAPLHVANFDSIVKSAGYNGCAFHRVIPDFMIQGGDPNSISGPENTWGMGDPDQANVKAEFNPISHLRGILSAARSSDPNSASSQFFICQGNPTHLDGNYTAYGNTLSGMDVVDTIANTPRDANDMPDEKISMYITYINEDTTLPTNTPTAVLPANNTVDVFGDYEFEWQKADSNDFLVYTLQFSQSANFSEIDNQVHVDTSATTTTVSGLEQGFLTYYWRVCTNNGGRLNCSTSKSFKTFVASPELVFPTNKLTQTSTTPNFMWQSAESAQKYRLQVSKYNNFSVTAQIVLDTVLEATECQIQQLTSNKTYYWRVASIKDDKEGAFSDYWEFKTTPNTGIEENNTSNFKLYPNPAENYVLLETDLTNFSYTIYDVQGKMILKNSSIEKNTQIDISFLNSGIYEVLIENGQKTGSVTFIKE